MSVQMVRCVDCAFVKEITVPRNILGDGYCPVSGKTLVGLAKNGRALYQPRKCEKWKGSA